jgi:sugar/nucleoside kinase (ribokinase family)
MQLLDIVALGDCDVDLYVQVERLPSHDEKVPGDYIGIYGGGVAANFACAAARLGMKTGLISTIGDDSFGETALRSLDEYSVNTEGVSIVEGAPTYFSMVALDRTGEKALIIVRTDVFFPRWEYIPLAYLKGARLLHIAPFDLAVAARAAEHAAGAGVVVSVDLEPGMVGAGGLDAVIPLLKHTRLLFPNEQCIEALFGHTHVEKGAAQLLDCGPQVVVVTRGAQGAFVLTSDGSFSMPAYKVEVRDTTGAGDCFNAAFVSSWLLGEPLPQCARFAAAAAALSITGVGSRGKLPARDEVQLFLGERTQDHAGSVE